MKLIIDIPDYDLNNIQNGSIACGQILKAVKNGRPYAESPQGEWILQYRSCGDAYYTCSLCNRAVEVDNGYSLKDYPFCHCGAKMEGGTE